MENNSTKKYNVPQRNDGPKVMGVLGWVYLAIAVFMLAIGLTKWGVFCLIAAAAMIACPYIANHKMKQKVDIYFYQTCVNEGIYDLKSEKNLAKATLIAEKKFKIAKGNVQESFQRGKEKLGVREEREAVVPVVSEEAKKKNEERSLYYRLIRYAEMQGREKFTKMARDEIAELKKEIQHKRGIERAANQLFIKKEQDWAVAGGIASGLAGGAAGLAVALDVQAKNAAIRESNMRTAPLAMAVSSSVWGSISSMSDRIRKLESQMKDIEYKLISEMSAKEVFSQLVIKEKEVTVSETGAVTVKASVATKEALQIYGDVNAKVDGTIIAELRKGNAVVGKAKMVMPIDGIATSPTTLTGMCITTTDPKAKYTVTYTAEKLWAIER